MEQNAGCGIYEEDMQNKVEDAMREGREKGMREGREKGMREGREEGKKEGKLEDAQNFKRLGVPADIIAKATGLSAEEIAKL